VLPSGVSPRDTGERKIDSGDEVLMRVTELERRTACSGETIARFEIGKRSIQIVGTFENRATLDDLLYFIACRKIAERLAQKRDNIVIPGGYGKL
jgi:hypothetical protein